MLELMQDVAAELVLSSEGHVYLDDSTKASESVSVNVLEKIKSLFEKDSYLGLLHLGILEFQEPLPASFFFWQSFSRKFISQVCKLMQISEGKDLPPIPVPGALELQEVLDVALCIKGVEYLNVEVLCSIWNNLRVALEKELAQFVGGVQEYLRSYNPKWMIIGRVCFHLAENKKDEQRPFAFLATYTTKLSKQAVAQHLPLKRALQEYAGEENRSTLLALLTSVQKAAEKSSWIKTLVDKGDIFHPQAWTAREAHHFLQDIPLMEESGIMIRVPNWWNPKRPPRPRVVVKLGDVQNSTLGANALLDFNLQLSLEDGQSLTKEEWSALLKTKDPLVNIKGTWVEIDQQKLESVLSHFEKLQKGAHNGISVAESMRLLAGMNRGGSKEEEEAQVETEKWATVIAGDWLKSVLDQLRNPSQIVEKTTEAILQEHLHATLRPYQIAGVSWLELLYKLKLGGCLADDMGLGKTIQVLALLLLIKYQNITEKKIHLLVVPASLLGNWLAEANKFTPSLKIVIAHSSVTNLEELEQNKETQLKEADLVITTYANVYRMDWLKEMDWDLLILDEAQLIKNPGAKQTIAVKKLKSQIRFTLTGTPIENKLGDLWSLFDFTSPGLLGSSKSFSTYSKKAGKDSTSSDYQRFISALHKLTQPYILRRLKSNKSIISDLPDKTEIQSYCSLSKEQISLYQQAAYELSDRLKETKDGIKRQGLILSYLLRFKQICNHPAQCLGHGDYTREGSGKFIRLQEICEEIAAKREKVLIFTQFTEIIPALFSFLTQIFGREGLVLDGKTAIKKRAALVESFQQELGPPFFVLSLKAGGTGLTLTRASHVIHFDRWWNPAVENQATDRAYRIGQKHPVLVHKFICPGTVEEKIDQLITSKKNLSHDVLKPESELSFSELTNEQLMSMISLDINKVLGE